MVKIILDTNLLLLLAVGRASRSFITAHKRTKAYSPELFDLLCEYLKCAESLVITPGIATETSNLARQFANPGKDLIQHELSDIIAHSEERHFGNIRNTQGSEYVWLGICDNATLNHSDESLILATDDFDLSKAWANRGGEVLNFNYIRQEKGL